MSQLVFYIGVGGFCERAGRCGRKVPQSLVEIARSGLPCVFAEKHASRSTRHLPWGGRRTWLQIISILPHNTHTTRRLSGRRPMSAFRTVFLPRKFSPKKRCSISLPLQCVARPSPCRCSRDLGPTLVAGFILWQRGIFPRVFSGPLKEGVAIL